MCSCACFQERVSVPSPESRIQGSQLATMATGGNKDAKDAERLLSLFSGLVLLLRTAWEVSKRVVRSLNTSVRLYPCFTFIYHPSP